MKNPMRALTAVAVAVALTGASAPAFASPSDGIPPRTVGLLLQQPAPGDGGVPAGSTYSIAVYVSAGDETSNAPTDRTVSLTFPAGVTAQLYRRVPGREPVLIPVGGSTVTDTATGVPVTASASWSASLVVDQDAPAGTVLTTTATSAGKSIGSTSVTTVPTGTATCTAATTAGVCATAGTVGGPVTKFGPTQTRAEIYWSPGGTGVDPSKDLRSLAGSNTWGTSKVYTGTGTPGAPAAGEPLTAYLASWIVSQGGGRLAAGGLNVTSGPKLRPGFYSVRTQAWGSHYGVTAAGVVYAQSAEVLTETATATIAVVGPVRAAPRPVPVKAPPVIAG